MRRNRRRSTWATGTAVLALAAGIAFAGPAEATAAASTTTLAGGIVTGAVSAGGPAPAAAMPTNLAPKPPELATVPLPTAQHDGVAWEQAVLGSSVYVVGQFDKVRPAGAELGQSETAQRNIYAYDLHSGERIASFAPQVNGPVFAVAVAPDASRIYIGGSFSQVNGKARWNVAALDPVTGAVLDSWKPAVGGSRVESIVPDGRTVYLGGLFTQVNGNKRANIAALNDGGGLTSWAPNVNGQVDSMVVVSPTQVVLGGRFDSVNGSSLRGLASLSVTDAGIVVPWAATDEIKNGDLNTVARRAGIWNLSYDGTTVYGAAWMYGDESAGNLEGAFAADALTGKITWIEDCRGDTYGTHRSGNVVYTVSHAHDCTTLGGFQDFRPPLDAFPSTGRHHAYSLAFSPDARGTLQRSGTIQMKDRTGMPAPDLYQWYPFWQSGKATASQQAAYHVTGPADYVLYAGEFLQVGRPTNPGATKVSQQGAVRFVVPGFTTPTGPKAEFSARVVRDQVALDGRASWSVGGSRIASYHWDFGDGTQGEGASVQHAYEIAGTYPVVLTVTDQAGQVATSTQQIAVEGRPHPYVSAVAADGARHFWRLDETSGTSLADQLGDLPMQGAVMALGGTGVLPGTNTAIGFDGVSPLSMAAAQSAVTASPQGTMEAWFRTTSTSGGKIVGFESGRDSSSSRISRQIYMDRSGKVSFGVRDGSVSRIESPTALNDGQWHHVVGSLGAQGMAFYVDGQLVGSKAGVVKAETFSGYWHIAGGAASSDFGPLPRQWNLQGDFDEVALYDSVLTSQQVANHVALARDAKYVPPTAAFTSQNDAGTVAFDASGSTAAGGKSLVSYSWDFGDGTIGVGATASHHYTAAGRYQVTLRVVDSERIASSHTSELVVQGSYSSTVSGDGASHYWRLGEASGPAVADGIGRSPMTSQGLARGVSGAIVGDLDTASSIDGSDAAHLAVSSAAVTAPAQGTMEAWFRTTSVNGGKIVGFENGNRLESSKISRQIYMDRSGKVSFGVRDGSVSRIESPTALNDGQWHHVVGSLGDQGMAFYVDGRLVGSQAGVTKAETYPGYWHIAGGTTTSAWGNVARHWNITADLDEVAVYPQALSAQQVANHYGQGVGPDLAPPIAAFGASPTDLSVAFDASGSSAASGKTLAAYSWDFGDGSAGEGIRTSHDYAAAGTYTVALTVTDSAGQRATATHEVTVTGRYAGVVHADGASHHWRLGEASGPTLADVAGSFPMSASRTTLGLTGALGNDSDTAASFDGNAQSLATTTSRESLSGALSVEAWFATTTRTGGKIVGFETSMDLSSRSYDRHLYMDPSGKVYFGVFDGTAQIIGTPDALNDGRWHHLVGTVGPEGMTFYVDGQRIGHKANVTRPQAYSAYWHIGGGVTNSAWGQSANWCIVSRIDEVAVYPHALTAAQVASHYAIGTGG